MIPETIAELLERTLEVIERPERHCIGTWAQDSEGGKIGVLDPGACSWCLTGAMARVCEHEISELSLGDPAILVQAHEFIARGRLPLGSGGITGFNDRWGYNAIVDELQSWIKQAQTLGV